MEFYNQSSHRSRRERVCEGCGKTIQVGETYVSQRGLYDGEFFTRALCVSCEEILDSYCCEIDNEFTWDDVEEYATECVCLKCQKYKDDDCDNATLRCPRVQKHFSREVTT
jgi:hypothetical protein